jgi:predicted metal-dependent phosphotriesterase family hydrolase
MASLNLESSIEKSEMIMTVTGPLSIDKVANGTVLVCEHLFINATSRYLTQTCDINQDPLSISNMANARICPCSVPNSLRLESLDDAIFELTDFKLKGGAMILSCTRACEGSNSRGLRNVSKQTGVPIVMGATIANDLNETAEAVCSSLVKQLEVGDVTEISLDASGICAGFIGEVVIGEEIGSRSTQSGLTENEELILKGVSMAHKKTGAMIMLKFVTTSAQLVPSCIEILSKNQLNLNKLVICGLEQLLMSDFQPHWLSVLVEQGVSLVCGGFGKALAMSSDEVDAAGTPLPYHDENLARLVANLHNSTTCNSISSRIAVDDNTSPHKGSLFLSNSVETKLQLKRYGGCSYSHLCDKDKHIERRLLRNGFALKTHEDISTLLLGRAILDKLTWWKTPQVKQVFKNFFLVAFSFFDS